MWKIFISFSPTMKGQLALQGRPGLCWGREDPWTGKTNEDGFKDGVGWCFWSGLHRHHLRWCTYGTLGSWRTSDLWEDGTGRERWGWNVPTALNNCLKGNKSCSILRYWWLYWLLILAAKKSPGSWNHSLQKKTWRTTTIGNLGHTCRL